MTKKRLVLLLAVAAIIGLVAYSVCKQRMGGAVDEAEDASTSDDGSQIIET